MGDTPIFMVAPDGLSSADESIYQHTAQLIRQGGIVAFPTETVYGLGANAYDGTACARIFQAKGRPVDNPLIVHVADQAMCTPFVAELPSIAEKLIQAFWPGPLTIVVRHKGNLPAVVTAGLPTVGIRMPDHPVALRLLKTCGAPIAAPSANRSGRPSPSRASHVRTDLNGKIDAIIDGGHSSIGLESTVVDVTEETPMLLRPGTVTQSDMEAVIGEIRMDAASLGEAGKPSDYTPRAPGMKYRHYSPQGELWLVEASSVFDVLPLAERARKEGKRVGLLVGDNEAGLCAPFADDVVTYGDAKYLPEVAANLYNALREFDRLGTEVIFTRTVDDVGIGYAIMNRLSKAAGGRVLYK